MSLRDHTWQRTSKDAFPLAVVLDLIFFKSSPEVRIIFCTMNISPISTEDEMAGWHHWLDGRESEWTPGVGDGQEGLTCCDSWGRKELDTTERLNWPDLTWTVNFDKVLLNLLAVSEQFSLTWERSRIQTHVSKSSLFSHQEHHHDTLDITQLLLAFAALAVNSRSKMEALY